MTAKPDPIGVVVVAGGDPPDPRVAALVPPDAHVVAADSGADQALALGLHVHELVGDLDSVSADTLSRVTANGGTVEQHPRTKDATDLEIAMRSAVSLGARQIMVIGGHGGRIDHATAGLLLLGAPWLAEPEVVAWQGTTLISVLRPGRRWTLTGSPGSLATLVPIGAVEGVTTSGFAYPLVSEPLEVGTTRGVSNVLERTQATVTIEAGVVLALQPEALAWHIGTGS